ncbi:hypothetical protein C8R45DRAFT_987781 [Mycena sanguinolenta]|nr:hypothetical protein C8R45DRAFT_987781 [Mycena sanguinolenta]
MSGGGTDPSMQSPFSEHFNTNHVPTDVEIEQIRAHLVPHEAEFARLEALIQELAAQRDRVKEYIEPHRALISHARRLPQEIVEEVFWNCLPTRHNAIMSAIEAPLVLTRICSAWRSIAASMPRLWASLHISTAFITSNEAKRTAMVAWLERSAPLPLTLSVMARGMWPQAGSHSLDIPSSLLPFFSRLGALHLSNIRLGSLAKFVDVHAPSLAEIQLTFAEQPFVDPLDDMRSPFLSSNIFRSLKIGRITISGPGVGVLVPSTPFTWDHITHLSLDLDPHFGWVELDIDTGTVYRLLKGCKHLISLRTSVTRSLHEQNDEIIVADSLESLTFHNLQLPPTELTSLIDRLLMPQLRQFCVPAPYFGPMMDLELIEHLAENSPLLSDLHFVMGFVDGSTLTQDKHL